MSQSFSQDLENIQGKKAVSISGGLSLNANFYDASGIEQRRSPFSYSIMGSPTLSIYGITFPFTIYYSDEQSSFSQPFNQYGVSPYYKWAKFHFGYRNVNFSPYTLAGHSFLGVGVELNPGIFRFGAVYGRFKQAIAEDSTLMLDSVLYRRPIPSYKRMGYSFKVGVGNNKNYLDLIYFKGIDDTTSIPYKPIEYDISPGENAVLGLSSKVTLFKALTWKTDVAVSLYTIDIAAQGFDEGENAQSDLVKFFLKPNFSTQILTAGETGLLFKQKFYSLNAKYKRVDPDYKSMGIYYIQGDVEQYTFGSTIMLFKNKWITTGSIGFQHDNIYDKKAMRTGRTIGSCNMSINPSQKFGLNLQYSNYGISQKSSGLIENLSDSITIHQISQNISVMPRLSFINQKSTNVFSLHFGYQELKNKNVLNNMSSDMTSIITSLSYSYMSIESSLSISPSIFYNYTEIENGKLKNIGVSMNVSKPFFKNRMQDGLSISYNKNYFDNQSNGYTLNINGNLQMSISKNLKHNIMLNLSWLHNHVSKDINTELAETKSFSEIMTTLSYNYNF
ncbi:MAG: hypothetical protein PF485_08970 [Bacteroidales bacterium]|nr:hypothetical protein [Bacteroidales bacterium]